MCEIGVDKKPDSRICFFFDVGFDEDSNKLSSRNFHICGDSFRCFFIFFE